MDIRLIICDFVNMNLILTQLHLARRKILSINCVCLGFPDTTAPAYGMIIGQWVSGLGVKWVINNCNTPGLMVDTRER